MPVRGEAAAGAAAGATLLYIEDNLANLTLVERILAARPEITLVPALQGQLGLELAWEHRPDLILLDLHLPDMRGDEVLRRLRADSRTERTPVLVLTADAIEHSVARLRAAAGRGQPAEERLHPLRDLRRLSLPGAGQVRRARLLRRAGARVPQPQAADRGVRVAPGDRCHRPRGQPGAGRARRGDRDLLRRSGRGLLRRDQLGCAAAALGEREAPARARQLLRHGGAALHGARQLGADGRLPLRQPDGVPEDAGAQRLLLRRGGLAVPDGAHLLRGQARRGDALGGRARDRAGVHSRPDGEALARLLAHLRGPAGPRQSGDARPQRLPDWNPNAGGIEAFYFKDPDGHTLEILKFPQGKGAAKWHHRTGRLFLGIDHTAIVVGDTEKSLAFYRDLLGMRVAGASENHGREQEYLNHVFGARLRITSLSAGAGPAIELLEYLTPRDGRPYPADARANDLLHWQTRLFVRDAEAAAQRLRASGVTFVSPGPIALPQRQLGFARGFLIRDPDGHTMEVIQR